MRLLMFIASLCLAASVAFSLPNGGRRVEWIQSPSAPSELLRVPRGGEPTLARLGEPPEIKDGGTAIFAETYLPRQTAAFTYSVWTRMAAPLEKSGHVSGMCFSVRDARPGKHFGSLTDASSYSTSHDYGAVLTQPRDASNDEFPAESAGMFPYGIFYVSARAQDSATFTIAGTEVSIGQSLDYTNFTVAGSAADTHVYASASDYYELQVAAAPLIKFYSRSNGTWNDKTLLFEDATVVSNEWVMLAYRAKVTPDGKVVTRDDMMRWDANVPCGQVETNGVTTRAAFETGAFARFKLINFFDATNSTVHSVQTYGGHLWEGWLTDEQLERVRDKDISVMQRRGLARWAN
jgi:hypothetical protein